MKHAAWWAAAGGFLGGAFLMGIAAKKQQAAVVQQIQQANVPQLQLASSTSSLNNGWLYFVSMNAPGMDLTQAANQPAIQSALTAAGFVDPNTKGAPALKVSSTSPNVATALTTYTGTTGSSIPASTTTLQWVSVLGYPPPEGLATA